MSFRDCAFCSPALDSKFRSSWAGVWREIMVMTTRAECFLRQDQGSPMCDLMSVQHVLRVKVDEMARVPHGVKG